MKLTGKYFAYLLINLPLPEISMSVSLQWIISRNDTDILYKDIILTTFRL